MREVTNPPSNTQTHSLFFYMKSRNSSGSVSITSIPMHLTTGATDSHINQTAEAITINGIRVKVGSLSHKRLLQSVTTH